MAAVKFNVEQALWGLVTAGAIKALVEDPVMLVLGVLISVAVGVWPKEERDVRQAQDVRK